MPITKRRWEGRAEEERGKRKERNKQVERKGEKKRRKKKRITSEYIENTQKSILRNQVTQF
jgi:hypothetical protein